jgi:putative phosphoesterase
MRIGIISDTHIPERASKIPHKVLEDFKNTEMILHVGDLVEMNVLNILQNTCPDVRAVWGNMDSLEIKQTLPEKQIIQIGNLRIGLTHGYGSPARLIESVRETFKSEKLDIIIFGHSHFSFNEKRQGVLYFNPGSPTDKISSAVNSYGILEIIQNQIDARIIKL